MSNYPPGVTDDDPYFGESSGLESEAEYQSRRYQSQRQLPPLEPEHPADCRCEECELPF